MSFDKNHGSIERQEGKGLCALIAFGETDLSDDNETYAEEEEEEEDDDLEEEEEEEELLLGQLVTDDLDGEEAWRLLEEWERPTLKEKEEEVDSESHDLRG